MTTERLALLPDAIARIECGAEQHLIRWTGGELIALDHDDPEGERVLRALGGETRRCIELLDAWARYRSDPRVLSALSRGSADYVTGRADGGVRSGLVRATRGGAWVAYAPLGSSGNAARATGRSGGSAQAGPSVSSEAGIDVLATLDRTLSTRLVATTTEELLAASDPSTRPALVGSLFGRASSALRAWTGRPDLEIELEVVEPAEAHIAVEGERLLVRLPLEWVCTVWARDLVAFGDRFALSVLDADASHTSLLTVDASFDVTRAVSVSW